MAGPDPAIHVGRSAQTIPDLRGPVLALAGMAGSSPAKTTFL
jgi:hypothetical protein